MIGVLITDNAGPGPRLTQVLDSLSSTARVQLMQQVKVYGDAFEQALNEYTV